jgi:hypothetical protein
MNRSLAIALSVLCFIGASSNVRSQVIGEVTEVSGVDLGITDDETYKRPNSWAEHRNELLPTERLLLADHSGPASRPGVSIAWRNAAQIEEVEVRVRNRGDEPGEGRVSVDILDEWGRVLLHLEPPDDQKVIRLPAYSRGGREGKVLRMKASRELNNLIDRYDRENRRYNVRATVATIGKDRDLYDNAKVKSWNVPFGVKPGMISVFNYTFKNNDATPKRVRWMFEHTPYPVGWTVEGIPANPEPFVLAPSEELRGSLLLHLPDKIAEGAFLESRIALVDMETGALFQQHEWFQVYDTEPPVVTNYRLVLTADHRVAIQALVGDSGSGVLEATGVTTEYSTDGGRTWSTRAHNYKSGNFVRPTLFEAVLGPFAEGTPVQVRLTAKDTAGNVQSIIPDDASGIAAPPSAEKLLDVAYIFPRLQPNPLFTLEPGDVDLQSAAVRSGAAKTAAEIKGLKSGTSTVVPVAIERVRAPGDELLKMTTLQLSVR